MLQLVILLVQPICKFVGGPFLCVCFLEHCCLQVVFQVCPSHVLRTLSSPHLESLGYIIYYIYITVYYIIYMIIVSAIPYIE
jgi:hypothetical protein